MATITGSLFGLLVGFYVFPTVIWNAYTIMYDLPALVIQFNWKYALLSSGAAILTTLLTTFWACYSSLKEAPPADPSQSSKERQTDSAGEDNSPMVPAFLYPQSHRPESVPVQKAVPDDGGRHRRLYRSAADRVWLQDSISDIVNLQFGEVLQYNLTITAKDSEKMKEDPAVQELLDDTGTVDRYLRIAQEGGDASANGQSLDVYLFVPEEPDRLSQFVTLQNRKSKVPAEFEEDAVLLTEKAAERLGVAVGGYHHGTAQR